MSAVDGVPTRLSLLEDEDDMVEAVRRRLQHKGYDLTRVVPDTPNLEDTVAQITAVSDAALCDHHLRGGHHVNFSGAEVVARLTQQGFPAVLFTGMLPQERYVIRRSMALIPAFMTRDEGLGSEQLLRALAASVAEVSHGHRSGRRRGRRTPVTIVGSRTTAGEHLVEAEVSGWASGVSIEIPADLLADPWSHATSDVVGKTFLATVNIAEPDSNLVFFEDFDAEPLTTDIYEGISDHRCD
jgi:CheY-like chemotaxis protein